MYHLSIGSRLAADFATLHARRIVLYQNVTPAASVASDGSTLAYHLTWGRADLSRLAPIADLCVAPSSFSAAELIAAGARRVARVGLPVDLRRLKPRPAAAATTTLLFVGRFLPHKRHDALLRVLAALHGSGDRDARLVLVGNVDTPAYVRALEEFADHLGVRDRLQLVTRKLSDRELADVYAGASMFLCASDHEGFCLPVVEAMAFSLPVLAFAAGAVPETVGDGGLVLVDRDPLLWASLIARLTSDSAARNQLIAAGHRRVAELGDDHVMAQLDTALALVDIHPPS
jgi:L-malate glycosyltransferase